MTLAQRIHEARISKGLTLEQLGKMIGLGKSAINKYEKGIVTNIPPDRIEALAAALDVTPGYLMGWVDHPRQMNLWEAAGASMNEQMAVYSEMGEDQKAAGSSPATSTKKPEKSGFFHILNFSQWLVMSLCCQHGCQQKHQPGCQQTQFRECPMGTAASRWS